MTEKQVATEIKPISIQSLFSLEKKTAIVTGAANGLGKQIALTFGAAGASVIALDKDEAGLKNVAELASSLNISVTTFVVDLSNPVAIQRTLKEKSSIKIFWLIS